MEIKSNKVLRYSIKTKEGADQSDNTDSDFIGDIHREGKIVKKGFFSVYHGIKPNIASYLHGILKIAEDGQAIYEFIQNAVDCNSRHFWIFYNDDYFVAINNGEPFERNDIASILNIGQSEKQNLAENVKCDKIGRFGIGFKLVHRLVGENDGSTELTKLVDERIKGPILFSWSKYSQLKKMILYDDQQKIKQVTYTHNPVSYENAPWLFKILLTNFPVGPSEVVKDFNYKPFMPFPVSELTEMINFVKESLGSSLNDAVLLNKGSLFFIKLGEGKANRLRMESNSLEIGVNNSMSFFKNLQKITINESSITKKQIYWINYEIKQDESEFKEINPEYEFCPIKISIGFKNKNEQILAIKQQPNFYKYFPLGDETNKLGLIVHSDAFDIESNRRKLHNSVRNERLINAITRRLINTLEKAASEDEEKYKYLFLSILLSDVNQTESNSNTLNFIKPLKEFIKSKVVSKSGIYPTEQIKIKGFNFPLELKELGFQSLTWFGWDEYSFKEATEGASKELGIEKWGLRHVLINSENNAIASFFECLSQNKYIDFIHELKSEDLTNRLKEKLQETSWIRTQDGKFVSINEIIDNEVFFINGVNRQGAEIFQKLAKKIVCSELNFAFEYINEIGGKIETTIEVICEFINGLDNNTIALLNFEERLFLNKLVNKSNEAIVLLPVFKTKSSNLCLKPLDRLISNHCKGMPPWLSDFIIDEDEENALSPLFQAQLLKQNDLLPNFFSNIDNLQEIQSLLNESNIGEFYNFLIDLKKLQTDGSEIDFEKLPLIFTEKESRFETAANLFWPNSLLQLSKEQYHSVKQVIETISPELLPHYSALQLKTVFNFRGKDIKVSEIIPEENRFDLQTANHFLDWIEQEKDHHYLEKLTFSMHEGAYSLWAMYEAKSYYSTEADLVNLIESPNNIRIHLNLFPKELYTPTRKNIGLLEGAKLLEYMLQLHYAPVALAKFVRNENNNQLTLLYLEEIQELNISSSKKYYKESPESIVLQFAIQQYDPSAEGSKLFKEKIKIDNQVLSDIAILDDVYFKQKKTRLKVKVSDIIKAYKNNSFPVSEVLNLFIDFKDKIKLANLLKEEESDPVKILERLNDLNPSIFDATQTFFLSFYQWVYPNEHVLQNKNLLSANKDLINDQYITELHRFLDLCFAEDGFVEFVHQNILPSFTPQKWILDKEYRLSNEEIPTWLSQWIDARKIEVVEPFLRKMGIQFADSPVVQLRKGLLGDVGVNQDWARGSITESSQLINTFKWLQGKLNNKPIDGNSIKPLFFRAAGLNISIKELPIPALENLNDEKYFLINPNENQKYHKVNVEWKEYKKDIFSFLRSINELVLDDLLPEGYLTELNPIKAGCFEQIDNNKLGINSIEFSAPFYDAWGDDDKLLIKVYLGEYLPNQLIYNSHKIKDLENKKYHKQDHFHYVSQSLQVGIPDSIKVYLNSTDYAKLEYAKLKFEKKPSQIEHDIELTATQEEAIRRFFNGVVPENQRRNQNIIAIASAVLQLPQLGYDTSKASLNFEKSLGYAQLEPVYEKGKEDVPITIMCRSARGGLLYLSQNAWNRLENAERPNVFLYAYTGNDGFHLFKRKQEILNVNTRPTDFQMLRIETDANAESIDSILSGNFNDTSKIWIIFRIGENKEFDKIYYKDYKNDPESISESDISMHSDSGIGL